MASEQLFRKENTAVDREICVDQNKTPKVTTQIEHQVQQAKAPDTQQCATKAIGDVGSAYGTAKARESHESGTQKFQSLSDQKDKCEREVDKEKDKDNEKKKAETEKERESIADKVRTANIAQDKDAEERRQAERRRAGGVHSSAYIVKKAQGEQKGSEENKDRSRDENKDANERTQAERRRGDEVHVPSDVGKFQMKAEGNQRGSEENRCRNKAELETRTRVVSDLESDKLKGREMAAEDKGKVTVSRPEGRNRDRAGTEERTTDQKQRESREEAKEERKVEAEEKNRQPSLEEISKYRTQVQQNSDEAIRAAEERYEREKQQANEKLSATAQTAKEKASQAKERPAQAKDSTTEKGQQGIVAAKDTVLNAAKTAVDYTVPVAEKAKDYTSDLKYKAGATGWAAAHFSTAKAVEGTNAAAGVVQGVAGYAGQKATEIAGKSLGAAKGLAAKAGESAVDYTARKKEEAQRESVTKMAAEQLVFIP